MFNKFKKWLHPTPTKHLKKVEGLDEYCLVNKLMKELNKLDIHTIEENPLLIRVPKEIKDTSDEFESNLKNKLIRGEWIVIENK